jgi:hypothetical protein
MLLLVPYVLAADPAPAMVTMVRGTVTVVDGATRTPAPAPPFILAAAQTLDLASGAHVVLLRQGGAFAVDGPRVVDPTAFKGSSNASDKVGALLEKRTSLASAGAARSGGPSIVRPVPNSQLLTLGEVRWSCEGCGEQTVLVVDLRADDAAWSTQGTGRVAYTGAALAPSTYAVTVGATERTFRVVPRADADALIASLALETIAAPEDRAAATAGALFLAGYQTDALSTLEAAGLSEMLHQYEVLAGVAQRADSGRTSGGCRTTWPTRSWSTSSLR